MTVALTGDAGDELFGGYERYRALALTEVFQRPPFGSAPVVGRIRWFASCLALPGSKTRLRKLQRLFEHINEPAESRYLGWMTTFDETARMALYSDDQLDLLTAPLPQLPESAQPDPAAMTIGGFWRWRTDETMSRGPWSPIF